LWAFDVSHFEHCSGSANEIETLGAIVFRPSDGAKILAQLVEEIKMGHQLPGI